MLWSVSFWWHYWLFFAFFGILRNALFLCIPVFLRNYIIIFKAIFNICLFWHFIITDSSNMLAEITLKECINVVEKRLKLVYGFLSNILVFKRNKVSLLEIFGDIYLSLVWNALFFKLQNCWGRIGSSKRTFLFFELFEMLDGVQEPEFRFIIRFSSSQSFLIVLFFIP